MARVIATASAFVAYGNSRPVAGWLAEAVRRTPESIVRTYHCHRHCVWLRSSATADRPEILESVDVARAMTSQIKQAMHDLGVRPPRSLDEPPLDWTTFFSEQLEVWKNDRRRVELLLGTRGFLMRPSRRASAEFIAIYGSRSILESCRSKGVQVRLVTSEDALRNPDEEAIPDLRSSAFSMTYSPAGTPHLEDEPIPLRLVDAIVTESATYTRSVVKTRLERLTRVTVRSQAKPR